MLEEGGGPERMESPKKCKPDFEGMIKAGNDKLKRNQDFQSSMFEYMGTRRFRDKMAELLGELVSEEKSLERNIEKLISDEESYKE